MGHAVDRVRTVFFPRSSALRRWSDRVETAVVRCAVVLLVLVVPVAVVLGRHGAQDAAAQAEHTRATARPVIATVLSAPVPAGPAIGATGGISAVEIVWVEPDLTRHTASVPVGPSMRAGDRVPLWVGPGDRPVLPPAGPTDVMVEGIVDAIAVLVGAALALGAAVVAARLALDRRRLRAWDADWWAFVHRRDLGTTG